MKKIYYMMINLLSVFRSFSCVVQNKQANVYITFDYSLSNGLKIFFLQRTEHFFIRYFSVFDSDVLRQRQRHKLKARFEQEQARYCSLNYVFNTFLFGVCSMSICERKISITL